MLKHISRLLKDGCNYYIVLHQHIEVLLELVELNQLGDVVPFPSTDSVWRTDKDITTATVTSLPSQFTGLYFITVHGKVSITYLQ